MEEKKETTKETLALWTAIIICLIPGFWISLFWYQLYEAYAKIYHPVLTGVVIFVIAYLAYLITYNMLKAIILYIIK